jgi:hypothetical protein
MFDDGVQRTRRRSRRKRSNGVNTVEESKPEEPKEKKLSKSEQAQAELDANRAYAVHFREVEYDFQPDYDPLVHPIQVIEFMSEGTSPEELSIEMGLLPSVIVKWFKKYPEFRMAIIEGYYLSLAWWKAQGRKNVHNKFFNTRLYGIELSARFGQQKKTDLKLYEALKDERFAETLEEVMDVSDMSDAELQQLVEGDEPKVVKRKD